MDLLNVLDALVALGSQTVAETETRIAVGVGQPEDATWWLAFLAERSQTRMSDLLEEDVDAYLLFSEEAAISVLRSGRCPPGGVLDAGGDVRRLGRVLDRYLAFQSVHELRAKGLPS